MSLAPTPPPTEVVLAPPGHPIDWTPHRKVWVGASTATIATAGAAVLMWVLKLKGVSVPPDVGFSFVVLLSGLGSVIVYFGSAYWVSEPPNAP